MLKSSAVSLAAVRRELDQRDDVARAMRPAQVAVAAATEAFVTELVSRSFAKTDKPAKSTVKLEPSHVAEAIADHAGFAFLREKLSAEGAKTVGSGESSSLASAASAAERRSSKKRARPTGETTSIKPDKRSSLLSMAALASAKDVDDVPLSSADAAELFNDEGDEDYD